MKKLNQTNLLVKYEQKMKLIILKRDGGRCAIAGYRHACTYIHSLVADHRPASRSHHATFFDPRNLTTVCGGANARAESDPFVSKAIMDVVEKREGSAAIHEIALASRKSRKWDEEEIQKWIELLKVYFSHPPNTSGIPKGDKYVLPPATRKFLKG